MGVHPNPMVHGKRHLHADNLICQFRELYRFVSQQLYSELCKELRGNSGGQPNKCRHPKLWNWFDCTRRLNEYFDYDIVTCLPPWFTQYP
jgi:hypothetical protein